MKGALVFALVAAVALGASGCRSGGTKAAEGPAFETTDPLASKAPEKTPLRKTLQASQVVWTRGGRLGYLNTYEFSRGPDDPVVLHEVEDLDFRMLGWISDSGEGERYEYSAERRAAAARLPFERIPLPVDTLENQVRRIFGLDPLTEIAMVPTTQGDLRK